MLRTGVAVFRRVESVFTVPRKQVFLLRCVSWKSTARRLFTSSRLSFARRQTKPRSVRAFASAQSDAKITKGADLSPDQEFGDKFMEFGDIDDFDDTSVFDGFDDGENFSTKDQYADEKTTNIVPNLSQKLVAEFLTNIDYDVRWVPKYDIDVDDEKAVTDDAIRVEEEEIFVIDELGYETEAQYDKLEARIAKMTRIVARELARQGREKAPEDLDALLREPPEFLHNARLKYTYHSYEQAQLNILDEHPGNHKVTLQVHVPHLDLDVAQTEYLAAIAGNRYCKASRNLKLVCRKYLNRLLNKVHVRVLLDRLLTEVRTPPPPPPPSPEPAVEGEEVVPAWVAEDPYGAVGEGEFVQLKQDEVLDEDDDKADTRSFNPYAAEKYYQDSIDHHFHKRT